MALKNSEFSRRKFMATSLGCLASAGLTGLAPSLVRGQESATEAETSGEIISRTLGRSGIKVPVVSMGGGACNDPAVVQACYEIGMRGFDTAAGYAYGRNEQMMANAIHRLGVRDQTVIITKLHTPAQRDGLADEEHAAVMRKTLEGSLRRLKTDYIDVLLVHDVRTADDASNQAIKEAMAEFRKEGKARAIGMATHADMANVINAAVAAEVYDVILTSFNFTMADDTDLLGAIDNAAKKNMGVIAMKTQAGGGRFPNPETLENYSGEVINSAALKWILHNNNVATTIPGIANYDHMRANFAVANDIEYTDDEAKFLGDNRITLGMGFCRQCSKCLASCPDKVDIPDLMRTHMYAAQYGDFQKARRTIDAIPTSRGLQACVSCDNCTAKCANSVDIGKKLDELKLMYA
jgi:predicted aldo/keto reductase-like oxidoreductase